MGIVIEMNPVKSKWQQARETVRNKVQHAVWWAQNNPELVVIIIPAAVAVAKGTTKVVSKVLQRANMEEAARQIRLRCYDPSEGHYWYLKRELSNQEWLIVNDRHKAGERLGDILAAMKVLK